MKSIVLAVISAFLILSLAACGGNASTSVGNTSSSPTADSSTNAEPKESELVPESDSSQSPVSDPATSNSADEVSGAPVQPESVGGAAETHDRDTTQTKILIAYFTVPETDGVDAVAGASRVVTSDGVVGNTQFIAQAIQNAVGGDLFAIRTVQQYPGSHDSLLDFAYNELSENARPELAARIENPDAYDVIFLGYPNWNSDLPMPLYTFLEEYDFSGKTIVPFSTHGGSGFSRTINSIAELQPDATVVSDGYTVSRDDVPNAAEDAAAWARGIAG
ncbi:flavodoxin [Harryflintia acetispora]|uniref:flavodoxin n=1 Tax=Harryflintia acetispora TaxID=1849041 RepID=UPI00189AF1A1|nr:flavodoxin [Harryflintia acetispora]